VDLGRSSRWNQGPEDIKGRNFPMPGGVILGNTSP